MRITDVAICYRESALRNGQRWREGWQGLSRHIVRSDVSWKGGVTGLMKTAALCEAFGVNCEIHTTTNALLDMANLHVSCAIRNCEYFEVLIPQEPFCFGVRNPIRIDSERLCACTGSPGLGVDIDFDLLDNNVVCRI